MNPERPDDCCAKTSRRSASGIVTIGVGGLVLCCALPTLLAGGALAAVAGWGFGVWAAIVVSALVLGVWLLRRRGRRHSRLAVDPISAMAGNARSEVKVDE